MKPLILLLSALALIVSTPIFANQTIEFDGESYTKQFENTIGQDRVIEYVREQEDLKNWTKLVSIRHFPKIPDPHRFQPSKDKEVIDAFRRNRLKWMDLLIKANFGYPFPE